MAAASGQHIGATAKTLSRIEIGNRAVAQHQHHRLRSNMGTNVFALAQAARSIWTNDDKHWYQRDAWA